MRFSVRSIHADYELFCITDRVACSLFLSNLKETFFNFAWFVFISLRFINFCCHLSMRFCSKIHFYATFTNLLPWTIDVLTLQLDQGVFHWKVLTLESIAFYMHPVFAMYFPNTDINSHAFTFTCWHIHTFSLIDAFTDSPFHTYLHVRAYSVTWNTWVAFKRIITQQTGT